MFFFVPISCMIFCVERLLFLGAKRLLNIFGIFDIFDMFNLFDVSNIFDLSNIFDIFDHLDHHHFLRESFVRRGGVIFLSGEVT